MTETPALRILLAEDHEDTAELLCLLLSRWGFTAVAVQDGRAALDALRKEAYDVALLDIGLPRLSGYEVANQLRSDPPPVRPYLVALTGFSGDEERRRIRDVGFDHYLQKPVDPSVLRKMLDSLSRARVTGP